MDTNLLDSGEELIGLAEGSREFKVHPSTAKRWCSPGILAADGTRIRLEHVRVGSRIRTTKAALKRFFAAASAKLPGAVAVPATKPVTPAASLKSAEAAAKELERLGA